MSSLKNTLTEAMKDAMRAKEKFRLGVIRMVLAEIKRVEVDERIDVDDTIPHFSLLLVVHRKDL